MNERKSVMERMFSNAFHALAFLRGLPSQTSFMTMIHRTSITIVIIVSPIKTLATLEISLPSFVPMFLIM